MNRLLSVLLSVLLCSLGVGCNASKISGATGPTFANIAGSWNLVLTPGGGTVPAYTFGLLIAQSGGVTTASQIAVTLPTGYGTGCPGPSDPVTISALSATQATITITGQRQNGDLEHSDITIDRSCTVVINLIAIAAEATGTYTASGPNGQTTGSAVMTSQ